MIVSNKNFTISQDFICFLTYTIEAFKKNIFLFLALLFLSTGAFRSYIAFDDVAISVDELQHIATGFEWLENGTYELEALHPPLARIVAALPLYLFKKIKLTQAFYSQYCSFEGHKDYKKEYQGRLIGGKLVFCNLDHEEYSSRVALSRLSSLLFFFIGGLGLFFWTKKITNASTACVAVFLYSNLPIIIASCIIINTDMAGAAFFVWAIYLGIIWLQNPTIKHTISFGILIGLVAVSKFSSLIFLIICFGITVLYQMRQDKKLIQVLEWKYLKLRGMLIAIIFLIIWLSYRFSVEEISGFYLPFPEFFRGLGELIARNQIQFLGYIFGNLLFHKGVWYFFPVATLFKLPLSFLIMVATGLLISHKNKEIALISLFIVAIYGIGMISNINIGLRHMLPAIILMCIVGAYCFTHLWCSAPNIFYARAGVAFLLVSYIISSVIAHKDYISYFNVLAGSHPEDILIEGDFDIGQDTQKLAQYLQLNQINDKTVYYAYNSVYPECYGIKNSMVLFGADLRKFQLNFGDFRYIAMNKVLAKFLKPAALQEIVHCHNPILIGETILIYDKLHCD